MNTNKMILGGDLNSKLTNCNSRQNNKRGQRLEAHSNRHNYLVAALDELTHFGNFTAAVFDIFVLRNVATNFQITTKNELNFRPQPSILGTELAQLWGHLQL